MTVLYIVLSSEILLIVFHYLIPFLNNVNERQASIRGLNISCISQDPEYFERFTRLPESHTTRPLHSIFCIVFVCLIQEI
jgi:hypothetical protein